MVPLNLMTSRRKAGYISTGSWSKKALKEAKKYGQVEVLASSEDKVFNYIPSWPQDLAGRDLDYIHITTNNTIEGTHYSRIPETGTIPLVSDMSSSFLSEPVDVAKYGLIYAGAQKNVAPAGVTVAIVREDLLGHALDITPTYLDYKVHADENSLYNTPPCYCIYIAKLVFEWIRDLGGLAAMEKLNRKKAALLYQALDRSKMFRATVCKAEDRSLMNVPFVTDSDDLNKKFLAEADKAGLVTLKGHRSVGGMRASIYNAMPLEGVEKLVSFIQDFERRNS